MKLIADTHTHTVASTHAYSTVLENARYASEQGLLWMAMTDHAPLGGDAPHMWHFENIDSVPDELFGVKILHGSEANILDGEGNLDLPEKVLRKLDWVVASIHRSAYTGKTKDENTAAYLSIARNPYVDVIGHCGTNAYPFDYETGIKAFRDGGKLVEINQNTFKNRKTSIPNCVEIARLCKKYQVPVVVNSDAHFAYSIGHFDDALCLLKEVDFPPELIINGDAQRFSQFLCAKGKRQSICIPANGVIAE